MTTRHTPRPAVHIGKLRLRGRVLRDLIHGGGLPIRIDEIDADADIGGDAINSTPPKSRQPKARRKSSGKVAGRARRLIAKAALGALSIGGMVAASGIASALGWAA